MQGKKIETFSKFRNLFSEYDDSVTGDSGRDPMGLQIIWSWFGQRIFGNQITSISNDIRNFTIALFHHYLVRLVVEDNGIVLNKYYSETFGAKDDPFFKTSLITFLENLLVFSVHHLWLSGNSGFDSAGLLGTASAVGKWNIQSEDPVLLFHRDAGILARQISLGINGRYKTPLVQCGLMDYNYTYRLQSNVALWDRIDGLFQNWKEARQLKNVLSNIVKRVIDEQGNSGKRRPGKKEITPELMKVLRAYPETGMKAWTDLSPFPFILFSTCMEEFTSLPRHYARVFGSTGTLDLAFKELWIKLLGFEEGAARSLYESVLTGEEAAEELINYALKMETDPREIEKLMNIRIVEPLLALSDYLFFLVNAKEIHTVEDIQRELIQSGFYSIVQIIDRERIASICEAMNGTVAKDRLSGLLEIPYEADMVFDTVTTLMEYQKKVMDFRGLFPWFAIDTKGNIRHHTRMYSLHRLKNRHPSSWVHSYYIDSMKSLWAGLKGKIV